MILCQKFGLTPVSIRPNFQAVMDFTDSPGYELATGVLGSTTSIVDDFKTYIMFRPSAGSTAQNTYVPLGKITWSWSASSTYSNGTWSNPGYFAPSPTAPVDTTEFPTWPDIYNNR
jgi:hypothetical protein